MGSEPNTSMCLLFASTTKSRSSAIEPVPSGPYHHVIPCGCFILQPAPEPKVPNVPSSVTRFVVVFTSSTTIWFAQVSATYTRPSERTATREGYRNLFTPSPCVPHSRRKVPDGSYTSTP